MFENFDAAARRIMDLAQNESRTLGHNYIGTEHLLLALLSEQGGSARVLGDLGVDRDKTRASVVEIIGMGRLTGPDPAALRAIGIDLYEVRRRAEEAFGHGALERTRAARSRHPGVKVRERKRRWALRRRHYDCDTTYGTAQLFLAPRVKKVFELSRSEARTLGHHRVTPAHLLLGLLREGEGVAALVLRNFGVDFRAARTKIIAALM